MGLMWSGVEMWQAGVTYVPAANLKSLWRAGNKNFLETLDFREGFYKKFAVTTYVTIQYSTAKRHAQRDSRFAL
jgi:hypothetical protein